MKFATFTHANLEGKKVRVQVNKVLYFYDSDAQKCTHLVMTDGKTVIPVQETSDEADQIFITAKKEHV